MFLVEGAGTHRVGRSAAACLVALALGVAFAHAPAVSAERPASAQRFPVNGAVITGAREIARKLWGVDPCGGVVTITWASLDPAINARATWMNPSSVFDNAAENYECAVALNKAADFDASKVCTIIVHEFGHLAGHRHTEDAHDVMSELYVGSLPACDAMARRIAAPVARQSARVSLLRASQWCARRFAWGARGCARRRAPSSGVLLRCWLRRTGARGSSRSPGERCPLRRDWITRPSET